MKISKWTIVRTLMLLVAIVNIVLERFGLDLIKTDESMILYTVETVLELAAIAAAWWYNNSFSQNALKAQRFLEDLKMEEYDVQSGS